MIHFSADKKQNLVVIKVIGKVSRDDVAKAINRFIEVADGMDENFNIITDLSLFTLQSDDEPALLDRIHLKMNELYKFGETIRVIGNSRDLLLKFSKTDENYEIRKVFYVPTIKKALAAISETKAVS